MTKRGRELLLEIARRTRGWPIIGVPADDRVARPLVREGLLCCASPAWEYNPPRACYRLTGAGELAVMT